jgi:hypothetical protein
MASGAERTNWGIAGGKIAVHGRRASLLPEKIPGDLAFIELF